MPTSIKWILVMGNGCWFGLDFSYANRKCTLCLVFFLSLNYYLFWIRLAACLYFSDWVICNVCLHREKKYSNLPPVGLCVSVFIYIKRFNSINNDTLGNKFKIVLNPFYTFYPRRLNCEHHLMVLFICIESTVTVCRLHHRFSYLFVSYFYPRTCTFFHWARNGLIQHSLGYYV